jgi:hypothetical protein
MTPEQRFELHEQWLRSMDSNHAQLVEDLDRMAEHLDELKQHLASVQRTFADQIVALATGHLQIQQELRDLREAVDRYIRFRGDGNQPQN